MIQGSKKEKKNCNTIVPNYDTCQAPSAQIELEHYALQVSALTTTLPRLCIHRIKVPYLA